MYSQSFCILHQRKALSSTQWEKGKIHVPIEPIKAHLTKFRKLFFIDVILGPIAFTTAVNIDGYAVFISSHDSLNVIFFKRFGEVTV